MVEGKVKWEGEKAFEQVIGWFRKMERDDKDVQQGVLGVYRVLSQDRTVVRGSLANPIVVPQPTQVC